VICAGIDAGSRAIKAVLIDADNLEVIGSGIVDQGLEQDGVISRLLEQLIEKSGCRRKDIVRIVATGYGRNGVRMADTTITEITCHACGVHHLVPNGMTVIEMGGQDSKLLWLGLDGSVRDFAMNDRCAAGTGRFLEVVAGRIGVQLQRLGEMAARSKKPAAISSMCVVFAETEILGLIANGTSVENIVAGVQVSIAGRVAAMAGRHITPPVIFTGGVALIPGMDKALEASLGQPVWVAPNPQMTGALGAAILATRQL
jgi:predicted CoA-substrate-specific enzyme activase